MLARTALARLRAHGPASSARDVAHISRQLAHTYLTSTTATTHLAIAPVVKTFRSYATATKTKKATTKKSPAKKTATRKTATRKTATRKTAKKPVKKAVKKAVKKPVRKRAAKKPVKKPAPKRRGLTERQKLLKEKVKTRENIAQLKATALEEPKALPASAWVLYVSEVFRKLPQGEKTNSVDVIKKAAADFKNIGSSELERLQTQASDNKKRNHEAYTKWVRSHTPQQILDANKARNSLKRKLAVYKKNKINDDRLVKAPKTAYFTFFLERAGSSEGSVPERAKQASQEWKNMSAAQKQKYEEIALQDLQRYLKEYKSVFGVEAPRARA
ncbi:uncharacterized protein IWZ02DRAFT_486739 [Phyllosticta citriasiana]|uniref:uncharacterized protein n=1 Tax=Phyllosticta citriasiana TaxID=595635 RepID=UPI0030FD6BB0